jgi:hydrogenase maturation protease
VNEWEWQLLEDKTLVDCLLISGIEVKTGDRVRLFPKKGGDILDIALNGQIATIESMEQDYEGKSHVCVVLDDDPGRDLGLLRQPGHRFFFDPSEVEPLPPEQQSRQSAKGKPRILVAGIGNIFLGDDGFGVEVAQQLSKCDFPSAVRVADFGIRGFDLAFALQDGYETTILIDAFPHGQPPGTVYVVEPDLNDPAAALSQENFIEPHAMNPVNVLRMATSMKAPLKRLLLVGCEPATFDGEEGQMGLSPEVEAAVGKAMKAVAGLVERALNEGKLHTTNRISADLKSAN